MPPRVRLPRKDPAEYMPDWSDEKILREMQLDTYLNRARRSFSAGCARIEQAQAQRHPPATIELRRMEFDAVLRIAKKLGVRLFP